MAVSKSASALDIDAATRAVAARTGLYIASAFRTSSLASRTARRYSASACLSLARASSTRWTDTLISLAHAEASERAPDPIARPCTVLFNALQICSRPRQVALGLGQVASGGLGG